VSRKSRDIDGLLADLKQGGYDSRCRTLRSLCPCRNNNKELALWDEVFTSLLKGGKRERDQAAHVIGTLLDKALESREWRGVLMQFDDRLDAIMANPRSARVLLGQMKRHGHAHRGAAIQSLRKHRRLMEIGSPRELADWLNDRADLRGRSRVQASDPGLRKLWRWHEHRIRFQPERGTREQELLRMAERFLPKTFALT
jgi:hypothetical protein